jgi:TolA-binding protein
MADNNPKLDFLDPSGMLRQMRDVGMDAWAKSMTQMVNSDAYATATAAALDAWLSSSAPLRKAMETGLSQSLAAMNLPSRDDVSRLAQRLTNIEMRLDDMEAKLDEIRSLKSE